MRDYSESFYSKYAGKYAEVAHEFRQSIYLSSSHPNLHNDLDLLEGLLDLAPGRHGLDAGCGAGARDVWHLVNEGCDMTGIDAVRENIELAAEIHPEIAPRLQVHNLKEPLPFLDNSYDFVTCNAVIQHIEPEDVFHTVLPELARVIRPGGVLQLMFKNGEGLCTVYDRDYEAERCFLLYDEEKILDCLDLQGLSIVEERGDDLGGMMYFTDTKHTEHCVFYAGKEVST